MPSNPFVALSSPVALGATLLGVSASLLALDVTGTVFLDRSRAADAVAPASVAAAPVAAEPAAAPPAAAGATAASARSAPRTIARPHVAAPAPHVFAPRSAIVPLTRTPEKPVVAALARQTSLATVVRSSTRSRVAPVVARTSRATHTVALEPAAAGARPVAARRVVVALQAPPQPAPGESHAERPIASLRDVRRFVIRTLRARDQRVCAISATAYTARDGHVVVDLVMRNRSARWSEKAVVRRNGTDLKLIGAKARALPYWTVASSGVAPGS